MNARLVPAPCPQELEAERQCKRHEQLAPVVQPECEVRAMDLALRESHKREVGERE
jgi:hypothetical protein